MCSIYQRPDRIELRYCIVCIDPLRLIVKVQESIQVSHLNLPPSSPNHSTKPFAFLNDSGRDSLPPPPVDATLCPPPLPPAPMPSPQNYSPSASTLLPLQLGSARCHLTRLTCAWPVPCQVRQDCKTRYHFFPALAFELPFPCDQGVCPLQHGDPAAGCTHTARRTSMYSLSA